MLIKCPECELQVSDKAVSCPHCGYPLKNVESQPRTRKTTNKRKRLPNGFGQISEIKNRNLRKRFRAMVTVGKNSNGRPICKPLKPESYFETYNDAYTALLEYNRNPFDLDRDITMEELYNKWSETRFKKLSNSRINSIESAWNYMSAIHNMKVRDVRPRHMKGFIEECKIVTKDEERPISPAIKSNIKSTLNQLFDYAVEYDLTPKNYARLFALDTDPEDEENISEHIPFTDEEMTLLWEHEGELPFVDVMLIHCYSGWRPQELCNIKLEDVDIENWTFKSGMKTPSGRDRIVPIHTRIRELVRYRYDIETACNSKYLFTCDDGYRSLNGTRLTYRKYTSRFYKVVAKLNLNAEHRPHDCRVQFVTQAKKYKVDEYVIKLLVGHKIKDVTEKSYTKRDPEWLRREIEKIP